MLIILIVSIILMILLSKYVLLKLKPWQIRSVQLLFVCIAGFLAYLNYNSINSKIVLTETVEMRNKVVQNRLNDIRDAQVEYKKAKGEYAASFDQLTDFLENDSVTFVKMDGVVPDSLLGKEAIALELGIITRDTVLNPVSTVLFTDNFQATVDSLKYIPFSGGKTFKMDAGEVEKGKNKVKVFAVTAYFTDVYAGLDTDNEGYDMADSLSMGSMLEPTTNGNWK